MQTQTIPALDDFTRGYLIAALWSTNDESDERGGNPLDDNYGIDDIDPESLARAIADCKRFQQENSAHLATGPIKQTQCTAEEYAGHDFWLTRNGHGCGFWDGDWDDESGEALTEASKLFGELWPYIGDDGRIYGF